MWSPGDVMYLLGVFAALAGASFGALFQSFPVFLGVSFMGAFFGVLGFVLNEY